MTLVLQRKQQQQLVPQQQQRNEAVPAHHMQDAPQLDEKQREELHQAELQSLSSSCRKAYASDLKQFVKWLEEYYPELADRPDQSTSTHMVMWLNSMRQDVLSLATIKRRLAMMRRLIPSLKDAAVQRHYAPSVKGLTRVMNDGLERGASPFMREDLEKAVDGIDRSSNDGCQKVAVLLMVCGFRRSELKQLTNACIQ